MADVYCDQALVSGSDNGTSWINAYRLLATALDGTKVVAGDTLWVKGNTTTSGSVTLKGTPIYANNAPKVLGCKSATSATPPANSDLIPGFRTGQATAAYADGDVPTLTTTVAASNIGMNGYFSLIYGLRFVARDNWLDTGVEHVIVFEECEIRSGDGESGLCALGLTANNSKPSFVHFKNCKLSGGTSSGRLTMSSRSGKFILEGCIIDITASPAMKLGGTDISFVGCDFSSQSNPLVDWAGGRTQNTVPQFLNCKINASSALVNGTIAEKFRTEFIHTTSVTGKTTGQTFQEIDIITNNGNIVEETTRFRTDGADDGGSGAWSLAFTPNVDATRDNYEGIIGPKMAIEVVGDGTAQTLTVYIANSSASTDYQDDEVWLVAKSPSETGTADYDFYTTQMDLLATPANVTDDGSTWGSGANNSQKLEITLSPDYDGIIECWVVFAKNFGADPETLYVDPLPVLS